ncbi:GNAT family N-acetyltransferase [Glaciibacter psychrotolerans]|uniref:GNAT superfamily N-acetyltransferase n=1 Tax=Glaciibacter psychrotolerans TaxID=670054 RepID=A0A7Z0EE13_9MICO|nr:GNAT family N-acetyltransferase [Leifsonia psychrotolerans]NYJ19938.1 GNAT superfamily N-acetyltransferase [Leifsonia psychrotolerans]
MPVFTIVSAADSRAQAILTEYFDERSAGFPATQGRYRVSFPDPANFEPPRGLFLLADSQPDAAESTTVGCGGIRRIDDAPSGAVRYEIKHLFVRPEARGHGWGRALLAELEARARELGARELVLDTNASLASAGALYRSTGFVNIPPYNDNPNATDWRAKPLDP